MARRIATIISRIFEPVVMFSAITIIGAWSSLSSEKLPLFFALLVAAIALPLGLLVWSLKTGRISNWDMTNRKERIGPLSTMLVLMIFYTIGVSFLGSALLTQLFISFIMWVVGFLLVTTKWKISGHSSVAALAVGHIILWFGWAYWPVLFIVPTVAWARVVRKDHTIAQVIAGAIYSWGLLFLLYLFK